MGIQARFELYKDKRGEFYPSLDSSFGWSIRSDRSENSGSTNIRMANPPVQAEKLAFMVKEALSSKPSRQENKVLLGSVRLSSQEKNPPEGGKEKGPVNSPTVNQDYHHLFAQMLNPVFDQIIRDCRGHIYDRLLSGLEKTMISEVLKSVNHNQVRASQILGISRNTLRERMKRFDIF